MFSSHTLIPFSHNSLLSSGRLTPVVYPEIYSLEKLTDGLAALESRKTWGKAIIRVKDEKHAKL